MFVVTWSHLTGERLTRYLQTQRSFESEADALAAARQPFDRFTGRVMVQEFDERGGRFIGERTKHGKFRRAG
jgi:hypothetical protein